MFITFEGIDGSGKTTQIELLDRYLKEMGKKVYVVREPGGTDLSENIRELLLNTNEEISDISELLLFQAARAQLTSKIILPKLKDGFIVISDRYFDSTTAYQGFGRNISLKIVEKSNSIGSLGVIPDITFYLNVDLIESEKRGINKSKDRIEKSSDDFFNKVIQGFKYISKKENKRFINVNGKQSIEDIHSFIKNIINKKLNR